MPTLPRRAHSLIPTLAAVLVACFAFAAVSAPAQTTPPQIPDDTTTFHAGTHLVILDVSAWDWKGAPVTGLTQDAFHLFEDGHEQAIKSIEEHAPIDPASAREQLAAVAAKLPPNTFTNFKPFPSSTVNVIVIDAATSPYASQQIFYELLAKYMRTVAPGSPFIVFRLDTQLHLVQGLTMDPAALRAAVELKPGETPSQINGTYIFKRQIVGTAVDQLNRYLSSIPGRKTLLWFTALIGIDLSATGDHNDDTEAALFCKWTDSFQQNRIDIYRLGGLYAEEKVNRGLGCHDRGAGSSIAAVVDNAAHFYTISYTPTNPKWDGRYRKLKLDINTKGLPWKGIALDFRDGYFGRADDGSVRSSVVSAPPAPTTESPALRQAMGLGAPAPDDVVFEVTAKPDAATVKDEAGAAAAPGNFLSPALRTQGYRAYTLHYAVRADQLRLIASPDQKAYAEKLEAVAVVYDSLGHALNSKRSAVSVTFNSPDDPRLQTATLTADLTTQIPAIGSYFLRIGVRDLATDKLGALEIPADRIVLPQN